MQRNANESSNALFAECTKARDWTKSQKNGLLSAKRNEGALHFGTVQKGKRKREKKNSLLASSLSPIVSMSTKVLTANANQSGMRPFLMVLHFLLVGHHFFLLYRIFQFYDFNSMIVQCQLDPRWFELMWWYLMKETHTQYKSSVAQKSEDGIKEKSVYIYSNQTIYCSINRTIINQPNYEL